MSEATYRFAPHPSGGFMLGLRIPQLAGFILTGALALGALRLGGLGGLALALLLLAIAAGVLLVPVRGHTLEQWAPLERALPLGPLHAQGALPGPARTARPHSHAPLGWT